MIMYTILFHFKHYKPYEVFRIDTTKDWLDLHIDFLETNKNIIIDDIIKSNI